MKDILSSIKPWILPKADKAIDREIDMINIKTIYYVSLALGIIQTVSLVVFILLHYNNLGDLSMLNSVISVSASVVLCCVGYIGSGYFLRKKDLTDSHASINVFIGVFLSLLIIWSMAASIHSYLRGDQILTFLTAELIAVLFIKFKPIYTSLIIMLSYIIFYIILNIWISPGRINGYNFIIMGVISVAGAVINYHMTVNYIQQKNKANLLNDSLEIIANHDNVTRLQNRYALNQQIPDYFDKDICLAIGDINSFKAVNDTYGHLIGDRILKHFSDTLTRFFDHKELYRYGGDEFLIISCSTDLSVFKQKLDELNEEFTRTAAGIADGNFSCSFGYVAGHPRDTAEFFEKVLQADKMLYEVKRERKKS